MDYENVLNHRLDKRWAPSGPLKPLYDFRPIQTKYTHFKILTTPFGQRRICYTIQQLYLIQVIVDP
jgi:hypothetical protein